MNCKYAREILNQMIDGESHPLISEARQHMLECAPCRQWHESMTEVLSMLDASEDLPMPDIAGMVMNRLPAHHPASRPVALNPIRALSWLGLAWLVSAVTIVGLIATYLPSLHIPGLTHVFGVIKTLIAPIVAASGVAKTLGLAITHGFTAVSRTVGYGPTLVAPTVIDVLLLAVAFLVWHRRRLAINACLI